MMVKNNTSDVSDYQLLAAFENAEKSTLKDLNIYREMRNALSNSGKYAPVVHSSIAGHTGEYDVIHVLDGTIEWAERFAKIYGDIKNGLNEPEPSFLYLFAKARDAQSDKEGTFEDIIKLFAKATMSFEDLAPVYSHILKEDHMIRQSGTDLSKMLYSRMEKEEISEANDALNHSLEGVQDYPRPRDLINSAKNHIDYITSNARSIDVEPSIEVRKLEKEIMDRLQL